MLVTPELFSSSVQEILESPQIAVDTETTGLRPYGGDRLFCISVSTVDKDYYFDYNEYHGPSTLSFEHHPVANIFHGYTGIIHMHNAKFDMAMLENEGCDLSLAKINCTMAAARVQFNDHLNLKLDYLTKELGETKSDEVKKYMLKHKLYDFILRPGKKKREKNFYFYQVPLSVIRPYAEQDTRSTYVLAQHQLRSINEQVEQASSSFPSVHNVLKSERRVTKVFYRMERRGVLLDIPYTQLALANQVGEEEKIKEDFKKMTGRDFIDSGKMFSQVCDQFGVPYKRTDKGNPSFNDAALKDMTHPIAEQIKAYRKAHNRAGTLESFLYFANDGVLHANAKQAGCLTGRVSYSDPPLQCIEKNEEEETTPEFPLRRCFVPRPGYRLFMLDYDQMEYRMALNYSGQDDLIEKVKSGLDVHTATAEMMGVPRKQAKCIAEGSLVLTDKGEVPIEKITLEHKIWDGESFCKHDGLLYKGIQEVITWDGVTGTPDHKVYAKDGSIHELQICKKHRIPLMVTGSKGEPIRYVTCEDISSSGWRAQACTDLLPRVRKRAGSSHVKFVERWDKDLQMPKEFKIQDPSRNKVSREISRLRPKMQQSKVQILEKVWWARDNIRHFFRRVYKVFYHELFSERYSSRSHRSYRQQQRVYSGEYAFSYKETKPKEYAYKRACDIQRAESMWHGVKRSAYERLPFLQSSNVDCAPKYSEGSDLAGDTTFEAKVYDIQNVGRNFRFTVDGKCVTNCVNFMLLYGGGSQKLADALGVSFEEAQHLKAKYFSTLPKMQKLIADVQSSALGRGYIYNWLGRRYYIPRDFVYKSPNYLIQGSCADWIKGAMYNIDSYLQDYESNMLLQIHDELLFEIKIGEEDIIPQIKFMMENVSPHPVHSKLPYTVGVDYSAKSWQDKMAWEAA